MGTSENAVTSQVWIVLSADVLVAIVRVQLDAFHEGLQI